MKIFLIIYIFTTSVFAQTAKRAEPLLIVQVPREIILPVIAVQPNCPIRFENVEEFAAIKGGSFTSYELRNVGVRPIRRFTIASSAGMRFEWARNSGELVLPGEIAPQPDDDRIRIVPITDKLRTDLSLIGPMRGIVVLMVVNIEFADGTKYDDEATYQGMTVFIDKLGDALYRQEQLEKQQIGKPK